MTDLTDFNTNHFSFAYDALGRRTQLTRPNAVTTNYTYDNLSRLLSTLHQVGGSTIDGATYAVDNVGNRTAKTNHLTATTENYTYDAIYQLTQVVQGGSTTESYSYDKVGNRTSSHLSASYTVNSSNQLTATSTASYTYDNNGNTLTKVESGATTSYSWDYENRLISVTLPNGGGTVTFKYDPFGRRIQKVSPSAGTTNYLYDGANVVEEVDSAGFVVARYTQGAGIDEPLAMFRVAATSYYEGDGLGSITSLTVPTGATAATHQYDTFGRQLGSSGSVVNPFRYTAREWETETNLYYYRARYYDPANGRFLNEDSVRFLSDIDFYRYVHNSPVNLIDPDGHGAKGAARGALIGFVSGGILGGVLGTGVGLAGGTLALPGGGTVAGGFAGGTEGAILGAATGAIAGAVIGNFLEDTVIPWFRARATPDCKDRTWDCAKEWEARKTCGELLSLPHPPRRLTGGYKDVENCAKGFVSEACGGDPIDWGRHR